MYCIVSAVVPVVQCIRRDPAADLGLARWRGRGSLGLSLRLYMGWFIWRWKFTGGGGCVVSRPLLRWLCLCCKKSIVVEYMVK